MWSEKKLSATAVEVTGDDSIIDVALLQPRGAAAARGTGAAAGSVAGGDNTWGSAVGAGAGAAGAQALAAAASELPLNTCVAITPSMVYLLGLPMGGEPYAIAQIDRDKLGVEVHQRLTVRVVILEDSESGHQYELEAMRVNRHHAKALIELLMLSADHHDDEEAALVESD